MNGITGLNNFD